MDIVYGDVVSKLGFRYGLLMIDRATKYIWFYGLKSLGSDNIIAAFEQFRADAGGLPTEFCCDCDQKLLGGGHSPLDLPQQVQDHRSSRWASVL